MALFSMIAVLLIEQIRPLPYAMVVIAPVPSPFWRSTDMPWL